MRLIWEQSYGSVGVDDICKQAGVTKGSFYFAFPSKSELALAAFEANWQLKRPVMDEIFSAQSSAVEQLTKYCDRVVQDQLEKYKTFGKMCGCPYCSIGSELSTQDERLRLKAQQIGERIMKYLTGVVRTAHEEGLITEKDHAALAKDLYDFAIGLILQAKIENNPEAMKRFKPGVFRLLGIPLPELVPA